MDQSLGKSEKLKSKKLIDLLFQQGNSLKAFPLRLVFIETPLPHPDVSVQVGFSVPKRIHKLAVTRNRIKRLMRQAYRTNKQMLDTKGTTFALLFICQHQKVLGQEQLSKAMQSILQKFNDTL